MRVSEKSTGEPLFQQGQSACDRVHARLRDRCFRNEATFADATRADGLAPRACSERSARAGTAALAIPSVGRHSTISLPGSKRENGRKATTCWATPPSSACDGRWFGTRATRRRRTSKRKALLHYF